MEPMAGGGGGGGGGPAPFLIKTYEMVEDSSTDEIVSWSSTNASFVVWNPPDFAANLLPIYFKHNNFSSFIRQLNTYVLYWISKDRSGAMGVRQRGLHKGPEAVAEEHPQPQPQPQPYRALQRFGEDRYRGGDGESVQREGCSGGTNSSSPGPSFSWRIWRGDCSIWSRGRHKKKKRRLPGLDYSFLEIAADHNNITTTAASKPPPPDAGQLLFNQDFCDKLKLGLCSRAIPHTNNNLLTASTHSSNDVVAEHNRYANGNGRLVECLSFVPPDTLQLSDTATSLCPKNNSLFSESVVDDGDGLISCHPNLTLASSSMQIDMSGTSQNSVPEEAMGNKEEDTNREATKNQTHAPAAANGNATSLMEAAQTGNLAPQAAPGRVNDVFWEQFLTERPGSSDTQEASSSLTADPSDYSQQERNTGNDSMWNNRKDMEQLTL